MKQQCDPVECAGINVSGPRITRSEFQADADINSFLQRYGHTQADPFQVGEVDYDIGLLDARLLVRDAKESFLRLPAALRRVYPTWETLFAGVAAGDVVTGPDGPILKVVEPPSL